MRMTSTCSMCERSPSTAGRSVGHVVTDPHATIQRIAGDQLGNVVDGRRDPDPPRHRTRAGASASGCRGWPHRRADRPCGCRRDIAQLFERRMSAERSIISPASALLRMAHSGWLISCATMAVSSPTRREARRMRQLASGFLGAFAVGDVVADGLQFARSRPAPSMAWHTQCCQPRVPSGCATSNSHSAGPELASARATASRAAARAGRGSRSTKLLPNKSSRPRRWKAAPGGIDEGQRSIRAENGTRNSLWLSTTSR